MSTLASIFPSEKCKNHPLTCGVKFLDFCVKETLFVMHVKQKVYCDLICLIHAPF